MWRLTECYLPSSVVEDLDGLGLLGRKLCSDSDMLPHKKSTGSPSGSGIPLRQKRDRFPPPLARPDVASSVAPPSAITAPDPKDLSLEYTWPRPMLRGRCLIQEWRVTWHGPQKAKAVFHPAFVFVLPLLIREFSTDFESEVSQAIENLQLMEYLKFALNE